MSVSSPRILVACWGVPEYEQPCAAAHQLHDTLLERGQSAGLLNLMDPRHGGFYRYVFGVDCGNPRDLDGVSTHTLNFPWPARQEDLTQRLSEARPDLVLAVGAAAALVVRRAAPSLPLVLLSSACHSLRLEGPRAMRLAATDPSVTVERQAIEAADLVIAHSGLALDVFRKNFPFMEGKLMPSFTSFGGWVGEDVRRYGPSTTDFAAREIDVCFVARNWRSPDSSYRMVERVTQKLGGLAVEVLGDAPKPCAGALMRGIEHDRSRFLAMLSRARTLVIPMPLASAPYVVFEAAALGCNIVASTGIGNGDLGGEALRVESFAASHFAERIRRSLEGPAPRPSLPSRAEQEDDLLETLEALL